MVLAAKAFGLGKAACLLAAMADERDPLRLRDVDIRRVWRCSDTVRVRPPFSAFVRRPAR